MKIYLPMLFALAFLVSCQNGGLQSNRNNQVVSSSGKKPLYTAKFSDDFRTIPEDFFVMEGNWEVRKLVNTRALYLQPFPLRTYSVLFGPEVKGGIEVSADVFSSSRGRTYPNFGIGSHGFSGFKLNVKPGLKQSYLELYVNETLLIARGKMDWQDSMWTSLKLQVLPLKDGQVQVRAKAWKRGNREPEWQVNYQGKLKLDEGQCSLWGVPYSGRDLFFDNLVITTP